jgi:hypothetical protein
MFAGLGMGATKKKKLYVDDVFSTYLYTGNGSTQTITNGINLSTYGGLVWFKNRGVGANHYFRDNVRGAYELASNTTDAQGSFGGVSTFNTEGFSLAVSGAVNDINNTYASWTFRKAPKFFHTVTVTKSAGSNATVDLSILGTVGMVAVKRTDSTGSWYVWHKNLTAGKLLYLEQTAAEATLGHITVSGTTLTLVNGTIADGTYVVYAWAHDADTTNGIIQCGSYTGNSSSQTINIGFEPQFILARNITNLGNWQINDVMRGQSHSEIKLLKPNTTESEASGTSYLWKPTPTGWEFPSAGDATFNTSGNTYIYIAIRRPNKPPTSGTQVYGNLAYTGDGVSNKEQTFSNIAPDLVLTKARTDTYNHVVADRLRGQKNSNFNSTSAEYDPISAADNSGGAAVSTVNMKGVKLVTTTSYNNNTVNRNTWTYVHNIFRRAPGFFDVVCFTTDGSGNYTGNHNLAATPELIITKRRNSTGSWWTYCAYSGTTPLERWLILNDTNAASSTGTAWWSVSATSFSCLNGLLAASATNVAYLFATLAGVSKVGSYTGDGSSQTINCGFSAGARFVLIKRTDSTGDWYVWDSARGIISGDDPHLSLNSTAAEVTNDDSIDPDTSGFIVNQLSATNINVNAATYIFLAIA